MKLTIFGASGRTGQHLVRKALEHEHEVIAFVRTPAKVETRHPNLEIIQGDVRDQQAVEDAIKGADGVICAIAPTPSSPEDMMAAAAENIIAGMKQHGVKRLIWSVGAGVRAPQDDPTLAQKVIEFLLKLVARKVYENALCGAELIQSSKLDWTIARAPMLTDKHSPQGYHVSFVGSNMGNSLSRENFAKFMLDLAESDDWLQKMPAASDIVHQDN
jgi:putative NADH-flavin reductase